MRWCTEKLDSEHHGENPGDPEEVSLMDTVPCGEISQMSMHKSHNPQNIMGFFLCAEPSRSLDPVQIRLLNVSRSCSVEPLSCKCNDMPKTATIKSDNLPQFCTNAVQRCTWVMQRSSFGETKCFRVDIRGGFENLYPRRNSVETKTRIGIRGPEYLSSLAADMIFHIIWQVSCP